jgi:hypothetical protein
MSIQEIDDFHFMNHWRGSFDWVNRFIAVYAPKTYGMPFIILTDVMGDGFFPAPWAYWLHFITT